MQSLKTESPRHLRAEEQPANQSTAAGSIDASVFAGTWVTTNKSTRGIVKTIVRASEGGGLRVQAFGACEPAPCDWGEVAAAVFSDGISSAKGLAFSTLFDFGFMEVHLQAKVKKGVLVVAGFNKFKDDSGRSNYFSREFFYRV